MSMTKSQRIKMMAELWPNACEEQGWPRTDDQKRYDLFAQVLTSPDHLQRSPRASRHVRAIENGRHISFNDFDNADFDAVKAHLLMLANNVAGAIETDHSYRGDGRRLTFHARMNHVALLTALFSDQSRDRQGASSSLGSSMLNVERSMFEARAEAYLETILKNRFKVRYVSDLSQSPTYGPDQQRGPSQLQQYIYTISRAIDRLRAKKKWTLHDLYTRASLDCPCLECKRRAAIPAAATPELEPASNCPF